MIVFFLLERKRAGLNDQKLCAIPLHLRNDTVHFGKVSYPTGSKLYTNGLGSFRGRIISVVTIRPSRIPKIINSGCLRLAEVHREFYQLSRSGRPKRR